MRSAREDGVAAVEFALIIGLLVMLLLGTVNFGIAFFRYQGVQAAAREGARIGALQSVTPADVRARVDETMGPIVGDGTYTVTVDYLGGVTPHGANPCQTASQIRVDVNYQMTLNIPMWRATDLNLLGSGQFRCENARS